MKNIRIGTWNLKDKNIKFTSERRKALSVVELLENEDLDFLAIQKTSDSLASQINDTLYGTNYYLDHIMEDGLMLQPNHFVRSNYIILKKDYLSRSSIQKSDSYTKNKDKSSLLKLDLVEASSNDFVVYFLNTNLSYSITDFQTKQFDELSLVTNRLVKQIKNKPLILTGDFNETMDTNNVYKLKREFSNYRLKIINDIDHTSIISSYMLVPSASLVEEVHEVDDYTKCYTNRPIVASLNLR